jgi:hypothetical protein
MRLLLFCWEREKKFFFHIQNNVFHIILLVYCDVFQDYIFEKQMISLFSLYSILRHNNTTSQLAVGWLGSFADSNI